MKKLFLLPIMLFTVVAFAQESKSCEVSKGFQEPKRDKKIEKWEKRMPAGMFPSLSDIKDHVAIDNDTDASNVILLKLSEQGGNGIYEYCVNGKQERHHCW